MLKITVDIFSGRPNPTWMIDDGRAKEILDLVSKNKEVISKTNQGYDGLGFRGLHLELMGDENVKGIPYQFALANGSSEVGQKQGLEISRIIVDQMLRYEKMNLEMLNITPVDKNIQQIIMGGMDSYEKNLKSILKYTSMQQRILRQTSAIRVTVPDSSCARCQYEESRYNPAFWNSNTNVMRNNNCYNYARNWRTDTFAQPGRYSGRTAGSMSCGEVKAAAMRDGLKERCTCLPQEEYPRRLMALVIAPGIDYHWYRKHTNGFWGHKPGGTAARNVDNSGRLITNPETCDRGAGTYLNYTDFCGYFYAGKSVKIR